MFRPAQDQQQLGRHTPGRGCRIGPAAEGNDAQCRGTANRRSPRGAARAPVQGPVPGGDSCCPRGFFCDQGAVAATLTASGWEPGPGAGFPVRAAKDPQPPVADAAGPGPEFPPGSPRGWPAGSQRQFPDLGALQEEGGGWIQLPLGSGTAGTKARPRRPSPAGNAGDPSACFGRGRGCQAGQGKDQIKTDNQP